MKTVIVAPSTANNSLGRALAIADVFATMGDTAVLAAQEGGMWVGAPTFATEVHSFDSSHDLARAMQDVLGDGRDGFVVAVKPRKRSLDWAGDALRRVALRARFAVDVDDHDRAIQAETIGRLRLPHAAAAHIRRDESPLRVKARLRRWVPRADLLIVSSWALRSVLPARRGPEIRLPHPRATRPYEPPEPSDAFRIGFLGTPRPHKGMDTLTDIVLRDPTLELHVLESAVPAFNRLSTASPGQLIGHPLLGGDTLGAAFRQVDVVVLPQALDSAAGRFQLPAKYIDALAFGRPVIASRTPVLDEWRVEGVTLLDGWSATDFDHAAQGLRDPETRERLGRATKQAFDATMSTEALSAETAQALRKYWALV